MIRFDLHINLINTRGIAMNVNSDSGPLTFACPHCGNKVSEKAGRLKQDPKLPCPSCKRPFDVDANQLRAGIQSLQKSPGDTDGKH